MLTVQDIYAHSFKQAETGCWLWQGPTEPNGYGVLYFRGVYTKAHRAVYEEVFGRLPDSKHFVKRFCNEILCVNPDHLYMSGASVVPDARFIVGMLRHQTVQQGNCLVWPRNHNKQGYGRISVGNKQYLAHRLVYTLLLEALPDDICVLHHCDNPPCVKLNHLYAGTRADNADDSIERKRHKHGEGSVKSKLTQAQVDAIRLELSRFSWEYDDCRKIGEKYGVSAGTIYLIAIHRTWKQNSDGPGGKR